MLSSPAAPAAAATDASNARPTLVMGFWLCIYGGGIIGSLVVYGLLQERIMTIPFGGELFSYSVFLVFLNRMAAVVFGLGMAALNRESLLNQAPLWKYLVVSLSNVFASTCQYECLKYVSFAVQMLGKSFKMMPVMVWGMVIAGKRYNCRDWLVAIAVTVGVTEFLMTGPTSSSHTHSNSIRGFLLLLAFLALDGLTSTMQERLFKEHKVSKYNQMCYVNGISAIVSIITLLGTGTFVPAFVFFGTHGAFVGDALLLSVAAVAGQYFIYSQVKEFGALVFAATMNVRQVVSIFVSYATYHHAITGLQVVGLLAVFAALFYKSYLGLADSASQAESQRLLSKNSDSEPKARDNVEEGAASRAA